MTHRTDLESLFKDWPTSPDLGRVMDAIANDCDVTFKPSAVKRLGDILECLVEAVDERRAKIEEDARVRAARASALADEIVFALPPVDCWTSMDHAKGIPFFTPGNRPESRARRVGQTAEVHVEEVPVAATPPLTEGDAAAIVKAATWGPIVSAGLQDDDRVRATPWNLPSEPTEEMVDAVVSRSALNDDAARKLLRAGNAVAPRVAPTLPEVTADDIECAVRIWAGSLGNSSDAYVLAASEVNNRLQKRMANS